MEHNLVDKPSTLRHQLSWKYDKGWINTELFEAWLWELFLEYAVSARPLLLLLDGHSTHYQPQMVCLAKERGVLLLCLLLYSGQ